MYRDGGYVGTLNEMALAVRIETGGSDMFPILSATEYLISCGPSADIIYFHDGLTSAISSSFASPAGSPVAVAFDGTNLISMCSATTSIYIHDGITSATTSSFATPSVNPNSMAFDGANLISSDANTDLIYIHSGVTSQAQI